MPLHREQLPTDDVGVLWWGNGVDLAQRVQAFAGEIRGTELTADEVADQLVELLTEPKPRLPELGDPPTLRRAAPPRQVLSLPPPFAEHVARRAQDPGA